MKVIMEKNKKIKIVAVSLTVGVIVFVSGMYIGFNNHTKAEQVFAFLGKEADTEITADFGPFWKVWKEIDEKYPDAESVDAQARVYGAISGLVQSLEDPYSEFFPPEETKQFEEEISGNFSGVGMEVGMKNGELRVIAPLKDTPAFKAGILAGDRILKIDDKITTDMSLTDAVKLMRGEKGTEVTLTILHEGDSETNEIKIIRDIINIPVLDTKLRDDGIFVISLYNFSANARSEFRSAIKEFVASKKDKLVLDLRGNPGGYLNAAIDMSSWFLPQGKTVVIEERGKGKEQKIFRSSGYNIFNDKLKFVILIDKGSASASEIVAGAMQDHNRAILVGEKSFGKGSVQEVVEITDETIFKVTIAKWLTPLGNSISEKGLTPDYEVKITKEDIEAKKDTQMEKAVELLKNWPGIN
jgi:carboxyl-terminal processing protease